MKSRLVKFLGLALLSALILGACELPGGTAKSVTANEGNVKISIPLVNPVLAKATMSPSKALGSKAYAFVDVVELDFVRGTDVTAYFLDHADYDETTNSLVGSISVLSGNYDKLWVSVFNNAVSNTVPVVSGMVTDFSVPASGSVDLNVTMYPYDPIELSNGDYSESANYNLNGEKWYRFEAPSNYSEITLKTDSGDLDAYIFGPNSLPLSGISGSNAEDSVLLQTTPNDVYYVCVVSREAGSAGEVKFANKAGTVNISFY